MYIVVAVRSMHSSLVPRPFPFLRAHAKHKREEKFEKRERPGTISDVR